MSKERFLNYANVEQFQMVLERYGGKEYLEKNFPHILQMLYNTKEWHEMRTQMEMEEEIGGYQDTFRIIELPLKEKNEKEDISNHSEEKTGIKNSVFVKSDMSLVKAASFLHMSGSVGDPNYGKVFSSFAIHDVDKNQMSKELTIAHTLLNYAPEVKVEAKTEFMAAAKVNGKSVCVADIPEKRLLIDLSELQEDVKNINVEQPTAKTTYIRLVYNGRNDPDAAYNFTEAKDRYIGDNRYVMVFYPFSIEVELDNIYEFDEKKPVNFDNTFNLSLLSKVMEGGEVHFNTALKDKIKTTVNKNILKLDFSYVKDTDHNYWGVEMPLTAKQVEGYFDFYLNFTINYSYNDGHDKKMMTTDIIVSSADLPESPNRIQVKLSRILWGCLGKDTHILTKSGYKRIDEVEIGESIFTEKGYSRLKNMVTGTEEKIIAVGVEAEKVLYITKKHPIVTERGIIYAEDLSAMDRLKVEDGSFKDISYLEVMEYNDKVYSPELEESALICADGIMVGDYQTPVDFVVEENPKPEPLEPELLEELIRWSQMENERRQKEVNV